MNFDRAAEMGCDDGSAYVESRGKLREVIGPLEHTVAGAGAPDGRAALEVADIFHAHGPAWWPYDFGE